MVDSFGFIIANNAGSARMRGHQMAAALGGMAGSRLRGPVRACVVVKHIPSCNLLRDLREKCSFLIFDPVDNMNFLEISSAAMLFDAALATNSVHAAVLRACFDKVAIIPHHHCVIEGVSGNSPPRRPERVGYVGCVRNLGLDVEGIRSVFPDAIIDDELATFDRIGIGLAYRQPGEARLYKSGVKVANYWAHGIAVVCAPEVSYLEMGEAGRDMLLAHSPGHALELAKQLLNDEDLRFMLVNAGYHKARMYNVDEVSTLYVELLEEMEQERG